MEGQINGLKVRLAKEERKGEAMEGRKDQIAESTNGVKSVLSCLSLHVCVCEVRLTALSHLSFCVCGLATLEGRIWGDRKNNGLFSWSTVYLCVSTALPVYALERLFHLSTFPCMCTSA